MFLPTWQPDNKNDQECFDRKCLDEYEHQAMGFLVEVLVFVQEPIGQNHGNDPGKDRKSSDDHLHHFQGNPPAFVLLKNWSFGKPKPRPKLFS